MMVYGINYSKQVAFNEQHELTVCKILSDWNEKRRVALDLVEDDDGDDDVSSSTSTLLPHNAGDSRSSNTNMIHSIPGGSGYV